MKAIEKFDPVVSGSRASTFVQARMTIEVKATIYITNPSYPQRTLRAKEYNTSLENAVQGIALYPDDNNLTGALLSFGLPNSKATAPTRDAVDIVDPATKDQDGHYLLLNLLVLEPEVLLLLMLEEGFEK